VRVTLRERLPGNALETPCLLASDAKEVDMRQFRKLVRSRVAVGFSLFVALSLGSAHAWVTTGGSTGAGFSSSEGSRAVFAAFMRNHDPGFYAENGTFELVGPGEVFAGREAIGEALGTFYGGAFTETDPQTRLLVINGGTVVLEFVFNGTHTGEFMGLPPTNRRISVPMLGIYQINGDQIQSGRLYFDHLTLMQQLGGELLVQTRLDDARVAGQEGQERPTPVLHDSFFTE
jgi:hypothetical protein